MTSCGIGSGPSLQVQDSDDAAGAEPKPGTMYILQVEVEDRVGLLHDVTQELWACELTVHRAHISTSPADTAVDLFYVTDERNELPAAGRTSVHFLVYFVFFVFFVFLLVWGGGGMGVVHRILSYAPDFFNFCIHVYTSVCALKEWTSRGRRTVSLQSCVDSCIHLPSVSMSTLAGGGKSGGDQPERAAAGWAAGRRKRGAGLAHAGADVRVEDAGRRSSLRAKLDREGGDGVCDAIQRGTGRRK